MSYRTDVTLDGKSVMCKHGGFYHSYGMKAEIGDFIVYKQVYSDGSHRDELARVIARINIAPDLYVESDWELKKRSFPLEHFGLPVSRKRGGAIQNHLVVLTFSFSTGFSAHERWVDPEDVIAVYKPTEAMEQFTQMFFGAEFPFDAAEARYLQDYGTMNDRYFSREHAQALLAERKARIERALADPDCPEYSKNELRRHLSRELGAGIRQRKSHGSPNADK